MEIESLIRFFDMKKRKGKIKRMKLLNIQASGFPLIDDRCNIVFYAQQRVMANDKDELFQIKDHLYLKNAVAVVGLNASGKTTVLQLIDFTIRLLNCNPINVIPSRRILGGANHVTLTCTALDHNILYKLQTTIASTPNDASVYEELEDKYIYQITNEKITIKPFNQVHTKADLEVFDNTCETIQRDEHLQYLSDDVSMMIGQKHQKMSLSNLLRFTNRNTTHFSKDVPFEILNFLDPSVEYLKAIPISKTNQKYILKFTHDPEEIQLDSTNDLNFYLSSGTVKGIQCFLEAKNVLQNGGYMLIDEIEDHFNQEIAAYLVRLFMDPTTNPNGGTIIFSTHYAGLLDDFKRNDCVYLMKRKDNQICAVNVKELATRKDLKKSESYQANVWGDSAPKYKTQIQLTHLFQNDVKNVDNKRRGI